MFAGQGKNPLAREQLTLGCGSCSHAVLTTNPTYVDTENIQLSTKAFCKMIDSFAKECLTLRIAKYLADLKY